MWEPDQLRIQDGKLPNSVVVDAIPEISPSPTELVPVITWITPGDLGYSQALNIACDWTLRADPTRQESLPYPKIIPGSHLSPTAPIFLVATLRIKSPIVHRTLTHAFHGAVLAESIADGA